MAVRIRLRRIGKNPKKKPHFRIGVYEESQGRDARTIDELGFYNPVSGEVKLDKERLAYWKKNGAKETETVKSLLKKAK
ncbi:MAG: 30S ribosomal protein S16 [Candidatus Omnitrophica bacterium]|nr:30S ribosomal protein S16 [Candidatus Omnitrophota bacterium]MDD5512694.1 30S ribosomal protein S16 [Candidatus Omnitrophota bacterium]